MEPSELIATSFFLGAGATTYCLGVCLPILVPHIGCEDRGLKAGLVTSLLYTFGRVSIYLLFGTAAFIGITALFNTALLKFMVVPIGIFTLLYGLWVSTGWWPRTLWCPFRAKSSKPFISILLGTLLGAALCPPLWIVILLATSSGSLSWTLSSIVSFAAGSSILLIPTGAFSGLLFGRLKDSEKIRRIFGAALVFVGLSYIIRAFELALL